MAPTRPPFDPAGDGARVLVWLASDEARRAATTSLRRSGFPVGGDLVDDVVGEAALNVAKQEARSRVAADNPAAYGTTVIKHVVHKLQRGDVDPIEGTELPVWDVLDESVADDVRVIIEQCRAEPWLTAATLAYLTFLMHPTAVPDHTPAPVAGSRPDQARAWPALWLAGHRDLFPEPCSAAVRRRRARRIQDVVGHLDDVFARYRSELERVDG